MRQDEAITRYKRRQHYGETPFAVLKVVLDVRRFLLRGIAGVSKNVYGVQHEETSEPLGGAAHQTNGNGNNPGHIGILGRSSVTKPAASAGPAGCISRRTDSPKEKNDVAPSHRRNTS